MTKTALDEFGKAFGYSPDLDGIWSNKKVAKAIDAPDTLTLDWMHNVLSDGFVPHELNLYFKSSPEASEDNFD